MRGKQVTIPILGMNNQLLNDQSLDGLCDSIVNLKPKGSEESPYWAPFEKINSLKNDSDESFTYEYGLSSITDAFWQVRNFVGEFAEDTDGSLKRLLVLCQNESRKCIDIIDPDTWAVVKTQALPQEGTYTMSCTRVDEVTIIAISKNRTPYLLYYLVDDSFIPQGWPEMPEITFTTDVVSFTTPEIEAGDYEGVLRDATDNQWFMVTWAFRLFDGTHVRHNRFELVTVAAGTDTEAVRPIFTLDGYDESILVNQPFWSSLISGISVFATIPRTNKKTALDDGAFFEVGYWATIDRIPEDQWPTVDDPNIITVDSPSESWPSGLPITLDNFTHHKFSAYVVDSYNKRLLLGGSGLDFALPKINTNAFQNTIPGGVYTDYMTFWGGNYEGANHYYDAEGGSIAGPGDETYAYEVNERDYDAQFSPKSGREFKTVDILDKSPESGAVTTPNGDLDLPTAIFTAIISSGKLAFSCDIAETNFGIGGFLPSGEPWADLKVTIGPVGEAADETIYLRINPVSSSAPYFQFSEVELEVSPDAPGASVYHIITIKTESGTYKRILAGTIGESETEVTLPEVIWYPDNRAIKYELVVQNDAVFELALSKQLIRHPQSNYAYVLLSTGEQTYTIGTSIIATTEPDLALNQVIQYIPNRAQAALSGNPFLIDIAATYPVGNRERDIIMGFAINVNPTSEGQAGQYPVFVLTNKGISALEQTGDPTIAFGRISPVSNFNGLNNPYSFCNAQEVIIAADDKYIYALAGLEARRIDEAIANDPDYKDYIKQMRIGYHRASDYEEVIFSNPFYDYSLCYNLKYKAWYKATERFKFFFYEYPELMGLTVDNVLKDFSNKDEESPVAWELTTRVLQYKEPYVFKRMYPFFVRMRVKQPLQEAEADYYPVRIQLKGYRDDQNITYDLFDQTIKSDQVVDPRIYNQFGSMYAYRIILSGTNNHKLGDIKWFDTDIEYRYEETRRRHNCSAQYLYTMETSGISICHCEGGSGTDAYFPYTGTATESVVVPHGLGKIPSVFVTDMDGFLIECGVQLILVEGVPSLTQIRLTFDDPVPFKAYFN